jgi:hypothetical protein
MRAPRASPGGRLDVQNGALIPGRALTRIIHEAADFSESGVIVA